MPTLPTLTVTQAQADRLLAAFGTVENYKAWLKSSLIEYVINHESQANYRTWEEQQSVKNEQLRSDLNNPPPT